MNEFERAADHLAKDLCAAGVMPIQTHRIESLYIAALRDPGERTWTTFYAAIFDVLATIEIGGAASRAAYRRLAALADDDLGTVLLTPRIAERIRLRLVEAA